MSKIERLKKRFTAFVNQLTPDQVREQLVLAYLQMEKCQTVLKGYDVEPESMMDNGESSDLELFYRCKKAAEELAYLNKMVHDGKKVGTLELEVKVDTRNLQNELDKIKIRDYIKPTDFHLDPFLRFKEELSKISESLRMPKFGKGQEVWYMFGDRVQHSTIEYPMRDTDGVTIYKTKLGHETAECETFCSLEELIKNLKRRSMNNNAKDVATESQQTKQSVIPFGKPARIGNFKIWKSKFELVSDPTEEQRKKVAEESKGKKKAVRQKVTIDCINVSILDGSWIVRIPQTFEQFAMLSLAYAWSLSEDKDEQVKGLDYLRTAISNMYYVSCICNGFYHHGVEMVTSAYADPDLLKENERGVAFLKDAKQTIERFLEWRKGYDAMVVAGEPNDRELHQDEIAEQAMEILADGDKKE